MEETTLRFFEEEANFITFMGGEWGGFRDTVLSIAMVSKKGQEAAVGYVTKEGLITIGGTMLDREPSRISSYYVTFAPEQWVEIGVRAREFREKCTERECRFGPAFKKLEDLAGKMFLDVDAPFRHTEIAKSGSSHVVLAGGKGEYEAYEPGIYIYDDTNSKGEEVKVGYRSCSEIRITGASCLDDELLDEVIKKAADLVGELKESDLPAPTSTIRKEWVGVISADRGEM